jgi:hypothetical protein
MLDRKVLGRLIEVCQEIGGLRERFGEYEGTVEGEKIEKLLEEKEKEYYQLLEDLDNV